MADLRRWLSGLLAFLGGTAAAFATDDDHGGPLVKSVTADSSDSSYTRAIRLRNTLRQSGGWVLTGHRSHSSHSSHRSHSSHSSHYSGSGGSYRPAPVYTPPTRAVPSVPAPQERQQQGFLPSAPKSSSPNAPAPDVAATEVAKLIMRIQLALNSRGYCNCTIDGKFGQGTVLAVKKFQKDSGLKVTGLPDTDTLRKLEVAF